MLLGSCNSFVGTEVAATSVPRKTIATLSKSAIVKNYWLQHCFRMGNSCCDDSDMFSAPLCWEWWVDRCLFAGSTIRVNPSLYASHSMYNRIGVCVSILFGWTCCQSYFYIRKHKKADGEDQCVLCSLQCSSDLCCWKSDVWAGRKKWMEGKSHQTRHRGIYLNGNFYLFTLKYRFLLLIRLVKTFFIVMIFFLKLSFRRLRIFIVDHDNKENEPC